MLVLYVVFQESGGLFVEALQHGLEDRSEKYGNITFLGSKVGSSSFVGNWFGVYVVTVKVVEDK